MRRTIFGLATALLASAALVGAGTASAATRTTVAQWNMNESPGAKVLVDSGPHHLNGTIGTSITLNGAYHTFPHVTRGTGGTVDPQHLDLIFSSMLNPGTSDFIVTVLLKIPNVAASLGNVMQKGQTGTPGGFWKLQLDGGQGRILCEFVSPTGSGGIRSKQIIADNHWHTVTCERNATSVSTTVDGVTTRINHAVGNISNTQPLSIGGKYKCMATPMHDCDYFIGSIDFVLIQLGG
jgi:Laminin G domain